MSRMFEIAPKRYVLSVEDVQMIYRVGKVEVPALRGVNLSVREGEFIAIMGPSGCGKSTLLHLMGGLLQPTSGRVVVAGVDIGAVPDHERTAIRRRTMGFVFQQYNLLPTLTAKDNIELAKRIHGAEICRKQSSAEVLRMLGLENKMNHKPNELSGGEQQRVALARAVINRPAILLADEPTGNLDSYNSRMVLDMLHQLNEKYGQTIVMITHNPEVGTKANRTVEMRDGRVLGSSENLFYAAEERHV